MGSLGFVVSWTLTLGLTLTLVSVLKVSWGSCGAEQKVVEGVLFSQSCAPLGIAFFFLQSLDFWALWFSEPDLTLGITLTLGVTLALERDVKALCGYQWLQAKCCLGPHVFALPCSRWHSFFGCRVIGTLGIVVFWPLPDPRCNPNPRQICLSPMWVVVVPFKKLCRRHVVVLLFSFWHSILLCSFWTSGISIFLNHVFYLLFLRFLSLWLKCWPAAALCRLWTSLDSDFIEITFSFLLFFFPAEYY